MSSISASERRCSGTSARSFLDTKPRSNEPGGGHYCPGVEAHRCRRDRQKQYRSPPRRTGTVTAISWPSLT